MTGVDDKANDTVIADLKSKLANDARPGRGGQEKLELPANGMMEMGIDGKLDI
jgi:hypothetical protein